MFTLQTIFETDSSGIVGIFGTKTNLILEYYDGRVEIRPIADLKSRGQFLPSSIPYLYGVSIHESALYRTPEEGGLEAWNIDNPLPPLKLKSLIHHPRTIATSSRYIVLKGEKGIEVLDQQSHQSLGMLYETSAEDKQRDFRFSINNDLLLESPTHDHIKVWNLQTFELVAELAATIQYVSGCNWLKDHVGIATEACMEDGDPCEVLLWDYQKETLQKLPLKIDEGYYRELRRSSSLKNKKNKDWVLATGLAWIDIWEWGTWEFLARVETLNEANATCLLNDTLYVGNMDGVLSIYRYTDS